MRSKAVLAVVLAAAAMALIAVAFSIWLAPSTARVASSKVQGAGVSEDVRESVMAGKEMEERIVKARREGKRLKAMNASEKLAYLASHPKLAGLRKLENTFNQDIHFYGKIVDQYDQPVVDAQVVYSTNTYEGSILPVPVPSQLIHTTRTGQDGRFEIKGAKGSAVDIMKVSKEGYYFKRADAANTMAYYFVADQQSQKLYKPDADNPVVFRLWNIEKLSDVVRQFGSAGIPIDGQFHALPIDNMRSIKIAVHRDPNAVNPFWASWGVRIHVDGGGLLEAPRHGYMFVAPESGYSTDWIWSSDMTKKGSRPSVNQNFYLKLNGGAVYASAHIEINIQPHEGFVSVDAILNKIGSRNLFPREFAHQISDQ